jgi:lyso-ornithine lipid O-acyltransferase
MSSMGASEPLAVGRLRGRQAESPARVHLVLKRSGWLVRRALMAAREARLPTGSWPPIARARALRRLALDVCREHAFEPRVTGALPSRPAVLISNHLSYIDPIIVAGLLPCAPVAKGEIAGWPLIGEAIRDLGVLFVRRGDAADGARVLLHALRLLREGVSVLNFPEGTTSDGSAVGAFRRGVFGLARLAKVPLVPLSIHFDSNELCWTGGALFVPHYLKTAARPKTVVRVDVGEAIDPSQFAHAAALATEARRRVIELSARHRS